MHVIPVTDSDQLASLAPAWHRLADGVPFRTPAWLVSWWEHYGAGRELRLLAVYDIAGQLRGLAPWYCEASPLHGRTLSFLGSGEVCTDYQAILTSPDDREAVVDALVDYLLTSDALAWDLIHLEGVAADEPTVARLVERLSGAGLVIDERPGLNTWRIALEESWESYVESLSKSHRKQVRRVDRRLVETGEAKVRLVRDKADLAHGLNILIQLHQKRRLSLGEPGCFADSRFEGFVRAAAPRLLEAGMLRLFWFEINDWPVSAEFQIAGGGVTYAYQAGLDPDALDEEPGRIANIATLKHAIESGQRGFDFLRGDEPYKAHWRAEPRASLELRIVNRNTSAQLRHGLWKAGDTLKQWIKTGLGRTPAAQEQTS
jgi:CelD/BcsL family acetyltransferase involved in cellulose biosynthesis